MTNKLMKSENNRQVFGVAAGLARHFNVDVTIVRLLFVLLAFFDGFGILAYILLAIMMPKEGETEIEETIVEKEPTVA